LLLEEPELSLHPEVVRNIPQMFARMQRRTSRQVIISTHSQEMLHDSGIGMDEVLLLTPGTGGTTVQPVGDNETDRLLIQGGASLADVIVPRTSPQQAEQLTRFGD
jgi:hypothetical protein